MNGQAQVHQAHGEGLHLQTAASLARDENALGFKNSVLHRFNLRRVHLRQRAAQIVQDGVNQFTRFHTCVSCRKCAERREPDQRRQ